MNQKNNQEVVTRFAPSPTGFMHIGNVRTALFSYLYARKMNGTFILRIEDTDKNREVDGSIEHIQKALKYLGIDWDYGPGTPSEIGPFLQSDRLDIYKKYALKLVEKGLAYPDPFTAEEVEVFRNKAQEEKRPFLFREHRPETFEKWDGEKPLRFKVPEVKRYEWNDVVRGTLSAGEEMVDDIIIMKADGYPTYNFAHIIDDHEMDVTHVMRGEEFISSTPKFLSLYDALEMPYPIFVTLPPIMGPDGKKKLSKRDGAKDLLEYEKEGYLPEAMRNFLALVGWNPGGEQEIYTSNETEDLLTEAFTLEKIQKSGGAFNEEKLKWMNKEYLQAMLEPERIDEAIAYIKSALPESLTTQPQYSEARLKAMVPVVFERIHNKVEITTAAEAGEYDFAFTAPDYDTTLLHFKDADTALPALPRLEKVIDLLTNTDFASSQAIKDTLWEYATEEGRGEVLWPLRTCLSGRKQSPDPFTIAFILGKEETLSRIKTACDKIRK